MGTEHKKYVVNADGVEEVVLVGINVHAKGREEKPSKYSDDYKRSMENYAQRRKQRARMVHSLIVNNFNPNYFAMLTLTFGKLPERTQPFSKLSEEERRAIQKEIDTERMDAAMGGVDYKEIHYCNYLFKKFVKRINYHYHGFCYVAVAARQKKSKKWHYHVCCNLTCIDEKALHEIWKHGMVHIWRPKESDLETTWKYLVKNMNQEGGEDLVGAKGYLSSRGLLRSKVLRSWKEDEYEEYYKVKDYLEQCGSHPKVGHISTLPKGGGFCKYYQHQVGFGSLFKKVSPAAPRIPII